MINDFVPAFVNVSLCPVCFLQKKNKKKRIHATPPKMSINQYFSTNSNGNLCLLSQICIVYALMFKHIWKLCLLSQICIVYALMFKHIWKHILCNLHKHSGSAMQISITDQCQWKCTFNFCCRLVDHKLVNVLGMLEQ